MNGYCGIWIGCGRYFGRGIYRSYNFIMEEF